MRKQHLVWTLGLMLAGAGCSEVAAPDPAARPGSIRTTMMEASNTTPLTVPIYGPRKVTSPAEPKFRVATTGGSGQYMYYWFLERCFDITCNPENLHVQGVGADTVPVWFDSQTMNIHITVQVQDVNPPYATGSVTWSVLGPATFTTWTGAPSGFCGEHTVTSFPFEGQKSGSSADTDYYFRDSCTGARIWSQQRWWYQPVVTP